MMKLKRYFGQKRVKAQLHLKAICLSLLKAANMKKAAWYWWGNTDNERGNRGGGLEWCANSESRKFREWKEN